MSEALLGAIKDYVANNADDEKAKDLIATLGGVADRLRPADKTSPGRLAAKLAATPEAPASEPAKEAPAKEGDKPDAGAAPKTFADAKAAALELVGR